MSTMESHLLEEIRRQMRGHKRQAEGAFAQLRDEDLFVTLDPESNSVAILIKHIAGNMRSRFTDFLSSDGEKPDRFRDREFEMLDRPSREAARPWPCWSRCHRAREVRCQRCCRRTTGWCTR